MQASRSALIGRHEELDSLVSAFERTSERRPQLLVIRADSGMGKTRLVQELYARLADVRDPDGYWPPELADHDKAMTMVPETGARAGRDTPAIPWLWLAIRGRDQGGRNAPEGIAFDAIRLQLRGHLAGLYRADERRGANIKLAKAALGTVAGFALPGAGVLVEIVQRAADGVTVLDGVDAVRKRWSRRGRDDDVAVSALAEEQQVLADEAQRTFAALADRRNSAAPTAPIILVVDDAHWLDPVSLEVVERLLMAGWENGWPLLVIATAWDETLREQERSQRPATFAELIARCARTPTGTRGVVAQQMLLRPLSSKDMATVIGARLVLSEHAADVLARRSSGDLDLLSDFLAEIEYLADELQTVKGALDVPAELLEDLPSKAADMARRRLRSSGRDVEQTLMLGSAQGPEFHGAPLQAAAAACGWSPLDEPLARSDDPLGITRVTAHPLLCHSVEFRRHVYFEVCEDRLERHPLGQRARLAVATALADIVDGASWGDLEGADQLAVGTRLLELLDDVAIDEQRAHRYRRTLPLHLGARRLAMGDPQGAAELIQPLLGHRDVPQHDRIAARRLLVKAAYTQGNPQLEASLLRDWATEESREHHLLTCQADFAARHGRASEAVARCREAVALLAHDDPRLVQTSTSLAQALWSAGQSHQALAQLTENEREHGQAEQMGGDVATARHHVAALASHDLERNLRVLRLTSEVISAYEHNGDREAEIISRVNLGDAQLAVGQGNAGLVTARQAYEQARESGLPQAHDIAAICLANALALKGEYNNALELYDEGIELAESIGHRWDALYGLAYQALCRAEAGQQLPERALWKLADQATDEGYAYLGSLAITHALLVARRSGSGQLAAALTEAGRRESDSTAVSTRVYAAALQLVEGIAVPSRARVAAFLRLVGRCEGIKGRPEVILEALDRPALVRQLTAIEDEFARRWRARFHLRWEPEPDEVTLRACDYRTCEARCCYDGVYLQDDDVRRIQQAIRTHPEAFPQLPPEPIVHGTWEGRGGLKTAVRAHQYQSPDFPEHFTASRCVFAAEDGACSLQVLGVRTGEGPWHYKPRACWAHPLHLDGNDVVAPPLPGQQDRDDLGLAYPGYTNHTPCGQHRSNGEPWDIVLADETDCLHRGNAG